VKTSRSEDAMIRRELHSPRRKLAAASPARPRFDAVAWNAAQGERARMIRTVAALLQDFEAAASARGEPGHKQ
jgi:hypothetical protein